MDPHGFRGKKLPRLSALTPAQTKQTYLTWPTANPAGSSSWSLKESSLPYLNWINSGEPTLICGQPLLQGVGGKPARLSGSLASYSEGRPTVAFPTGGAFPADRSGWGASVGLPLAASDSSPTALLSPRRRLLTRGAIRLVLQAPPWQSAGSPVSSSVPLDSLVIPLGSWKLSVPLSFARCPLGIPPRQGLTPSVPEWREQLQCSHTCCPSLWGPKLQGARGRGQPRPSGVTGKV